MWVILIGLLVGVVVGLKLPLVLPAVVARYLGIAVLAALDTAFGGLRASMERKFNNAVFISGFFSNAALAAGLAYLGDRLGLPEIYMAGVVALGMRMFQNLGVIRRLAFEHWNLIRRQNQPEAGATAEK
jgi:small basic protein